MTQADTKSVFQAKLLQPANTGGETPWGFVVLPHEVSAKLPRRGRTSVEGTINGQPFAATLEPDGQLSHWLKLSRKLCEAAGANFGDLLTLDIKAVAQEPEPELPTDFREALAAAADARKVWAATTTIARLDWIHWIVSAKQSSTRQKRIADACAMLAGGKKRVCCFDPSGYYSKAFRVPDVAD